MVDWNPNFPEVFGLEWLATRNVTGRVWAGAPARMARLPSTTAETISALRLSAMVDPLSRASVPTLIDIIEEGNEVTPLPKFARLPPTVDRVNEGWETDSGGSTNLWDSIDQSTSQWPGPADGTDIRTTEPFTAYAAGVDTTRFQAGGAAENGRIHWVAIGAILAAPAGVFRKLGITLLIDGTHYHPAGGALRDVHGFGALYEFWFGELNPATGLPWTPAEIANFGTESDWGIRFRSQGDATTTKFPRVMSASLNVHYAETEDREAVGVWRRPEDIGTERLVNIETDNLLSLPDGTADWSKPSGTNHLYYWRQTVSPDQYGPIVADDVRWGGAYQDLGPGGEPPGIVYPLSSVSDPSEMPDDVLAAKPIPYDQFGRPTAAFDDSDLRPGRSAFGLVLVDDLGDLSIDSQPYRLDLSDVVFLTSTSGTMAQRITPSSAQDYLGIRLPIIPLGTGPGTATLTIAVHRVSDGVQIGGTFSLTKTEVRALPAGSGGLRYVTGFLSSGASLASSTQYEVRISTNSVSGWHLFAPDCSLGPETSFGGDTDGAVIDGTHDTDRDMAINLIRQPDAPENVIAAITLVPVSVSYVADQVPDVEHVEVTWDQPAVGMGAIFKRYELERQLDGGVWQRVANINNAAVISYEDRAAPRDTAATYRIRAVGTDGRISQWETSNSATPSAPGSIVILTSEHRPDLEVVYFRDRESTYPILSTERDETVMIHGSDFQVVFMESEDRGIGWRTVITINQTVLQGKGGQHVLGPLLDLLRSREIPYVVVLDDEGTQILGHVEFPESTRRQPQHIYRAQISVIPTTATPVPVEVS